MISLYKGSQIPITNGLILVYKNHMKRTYQTSKQNLQTKINGLLFFVFIYCIIMCFIQFYKSIKNAICIVHTREHNN
jgi:hypothetical protein